MNRGQIEIIFGPMFSGKSTELIRRVKRCMIAKEKCMVVKYAHDTRYDDEKMATHDQLKFDAFPCLKMAEVEERALEYDVIGIDEGQFFPDIVEVCENLANKGKLVIVAALDGTFQRKAFGDILNLVPLAEKVTKLTAICIGCFNDAAFTQRFTQDKRVEVIGGSEMYKPVCRECFMAENRSQKEELTAAAATSNKENMPMKQRPLKITSKQVLGELIQN